MKLILLVTLIIFGFQSSAWGQAPTLSTEAKQEPIQEIMRKIEYQTGMIFPYDPSILKDISRIIFKPDNRFISECPTRPFQKLPLSYQINDTHIILKELPRSVTISGLIRDKATTEYLTGASVYDSRTQRGTTINNHGFPSLTLPAGVIRLETSYIGYGCFSHTFQPLGRDTVTEILPGSGEVLVGVVVVGSDNTQNPIQALQMGTIKITRKMIRTTPTLFDGADVIRTPRTQPGMSVGTEGSAGVYIRGGNGDESLCMVDGIQLYQVNHLEGLSSAFDAEALKSVGFYRSVFPARHRGRPSSVMGVHTKDGNTKEYHDSAMPGLISGSLNFEGPITKDRTLFNVFFRRSRLDTLSAPGLTIHNRIQKKEREKFSVRYVFTDLDLKVNHYVNNRSQAYVNFYFGQDFLKGESSESSVDNDITPLENKGFGKMRWDNIALFSGWPYVFNNKTFSTVTLTYSHHQSKLKQEISQRYGTEGDKDYSSRSIKTSIRNGINDFGVHANFNHTPTLAHHIYYGTDYLYHRFSLGYIEGKTSKNLSPTEQTTRDERLSTNELAVFAEDDWAISPIVRANAGSRLNMYNIQKKTYVSPDSHLSVRFLFTRDPNLKASYVRMNQYVYQTSESYISLPTDMWMPVGKKLKPLASDQVSTDVHYNLYKNYSLPMEGYYKWVNCLLDYEDGYSFSPSLIGQEEKLAAGKRWTCGAEFIARKETGCIAGWIGYGLTWSDRQPNKINNGERFPAKYDDRHKLDIVVNQKINEKLELARSWTFMTGNRATAAFEDYEDLGFTPVPLLLSEGGLDYSTEYNNVRLPAYYRLDLGINIYRPRKNGHLGIQNISIYSTYCQVSPITIHKRSWTNYSHYFETLPPLSIIPSISYAYKF